MLKPTTMSTTAPGHAKFRAFALVIPLPSEHPSLHIALTAFQKNLGDDADKLYAVLMDDTWFENRFAVVTIPVGYLVPFAESLRVHNLSLVRGTPTVFNDTEHSFYNPGPLLRELGIEIEGRIFVFEVLPPSGEVIRKGVTLADVRRK